MPEPKKHYTADKRRPPSAFAAALEELHIPWLTGELQGVERLLELGELDAAAPAAETLEMASLPLRDRHWLAAARALRGRIAARRGELRGAICRLLLALEHLDRGRDPDFFDRAVHALAECLRRAPAVKAAFATALKNIRRRRYRPGLAAWGQHRWLEGLVLSRRRSEAARSALRGAVRHLLAAGARRDAALALTDLAELCAAEHDFTDALAPARRVLDALESADAARPDLLAFRAFVARLQEGTADAAAARRLRRELD